MDVQARRGHGLFLHPREDDPPPRVLPRHVLDGGVPIFAFSILSLNTNFTSVYT